MGKGRLFNKDLKYDNINITCNTVDKDNLKSIYIIVSGYFDLDEEELIGLRRKIGKTIRQSIDPKVFYNQKIIEIEETRDNGDMTYGGFEYTIFLSKDNKIEWRELQTYTKEIMDLIHQQYFINPEFKVCKTK